MRSYNDLIALVRQWSNRDEEVVNNAIIGDCLAYAADKAYRFLRIPPLERVINYTSETLQANTTNSNSRVFSITTLTIPEDLIEFIQIRAVNSDGRTTRVFNEKTDVRTFYDQFAEKYTNLAYWTRKENKILLSPGFNNVTEETVELYYYRRLFDLSTRYEVTAVNANISDTYISEVSVANPIPTNLRTGAAVPSKDLKKVDYRLGNSSGEIVSTTYYETTVADEDIPDVLGQYTDINTNTYYGTEVYNWLRDENERILLNGALAELFVYLQEPETASMYAQIFTNEIQELNQEEKSRKASGGNIQINLNGNGLI